MVDGEICLSESASKTDKNLPDYHRILPSPSQPQTAFLLPWKSQTKDKRFSSSRIKLSFSYFSVSAVENEYHSLFSSSSYDEHLFELVLPRTCSLGHIDVKFQLHPMCTTAPNIQVTLLKQNISNIGRQSDSQAAVSSDVDAKIDFINDIGQAGPEDKPFSFASSTSYTTSPNGTQQPLQASVINNVLNPQFLKRYSAEILCGPVDLASHVDLSGHSGVISLTSPQLLKVKSRSFLVHIKALSTGKEDGEKGAASSNNKKNSRSGSSSPNNPSQVPPTLSSATVSKEKAGLKCLLSAGSSGSKPKLENIKGCDWLQEVSITVRRCKRNKKTTMPRDR